MPHHRLLHNPRWLTAMHARGATIRQIASILNCHRTTVREAFDRYDLDPRHGRPHEH